jgi:hypothetical protein
MYVGQFKKFEIRFQINKYAAKIRIVLVNLFRSNLALKNKLQSAYLFTYSYLIRFFITVYCVKAVWLKMLQNVGKVS